jgi:alpha-1,2-mannosyltransferase
MLARAGADPHSAAGMTGWLALSAVVVVLTCFGMRHALAQSGDSWALSLNAFAALLISPISWSHHWVWGEWWCPSGGNRELHWGAWQQALGSSYVLLALTVVALSVPREGPFREVCRRLARRQMISDRLPRAATSCGSAGPPRRQSREF